MTEENENLPVSPTSRKRSNLLAVIVGLAMISTIGLLTFFKNYHASSKLEEVKKEAEESLRKASKITADDLQDRINKGEAIAVVDIRSQKEYELDHIKNSKNISLGDFEKLWPSLDKNKAYVIMDDGQTMEGAMVASTMMSEGFKKVYYLGGGYIAWKNKKKPTISAGNPLSAVDYVKVSPISSDGLNNWLANEKEKKDLFLIDVSSVQEYSQEHLENSVNIPIDELEKREKEIPIAKDIVIYGSTDLLSFRGAVKLFDLGHYNASTLSGGLEEWKKKGFKVIK